MTQIPAGWLPRLGEQQQLAAHPDEPIYDELVAEFGDPLDRPAAGPDPDRKLAAGPQPTTETEGAQS